MPGQPDKTQPDQRDETGGDARLRGFVGYGMKRAYARVQQDAARVLEPLGLRLSTFSALVVIRENPGIRQSELALLLRIERSNTVAVVEALEAAGLVERARMARDRRSFALSVTAPGEALCHRALAAVEAHEAALLEGLSGAERATLRALLARVETG